MTCLTTICQFSTLGKLYSLFLLLSKSSPPGKSLLPSLLQHHSSIRTRPNSEPLFANHASKIHITGKWYQMERVKYSRKIWEHARD